MRRTKQKAGERFRDEKRTGGPRMHGEGWHDEREPRDMSPELRDLDALPEAESSGEREGMRKAKGHREGNSGASRK